MFGAATGGGMVLMGGSGGGGGGGNPGGLGVGGAGRGGGSRRHRAASAQSQGLRGREQEGAIVGVLVEVGIRPAVARRWRFVDGGGGAGGGGGGGGGGQGQLVAELLHFPGQTQHRVGVVGGDRVGERLESERRCTGPHHRGDDDDNNYQ